jgi:hypothetical protein
MKVQFADSFGKSLKRLIWHESRVYKFYDFFRRDIGRFVKNVWLFRKALANHYWWDYRGTLMFMETGLSHMAENLEKRGNEVEVSRFKKIAAMKRATEIIRNYNESNYIDMAEAELGELYRRDWEWEETGETTDNPFGEKDAKLYRLVDNETPIEKKHNCKVYTRARKIEELEWKELFTILQGQNHKEYNRLYKKAKKEGMKDDKDLWNNWFNGTGLKGWWD